MLPRLCLVSNRIHSNACWLITGTLAALEIQSSDHSGLLLCSQGAQIAPAIPRAKSEAPVKSATKEPNLTDADIVAFSSRVIAAARAIESRRSDRLFNDPFAELLAGPEAMRRSEERQSPPVEPVEVAEDGDRSSPPIEVTGAPKKENRLPSRRLAIRTRFCDDFFENCTGAKGIKQIVSLGSGMDTRGLRLRAPSDTTVFDVDQALVLRVKRKLLEGAGTIEVNVKERQESAARARVVAVEADLSQAGWEGELFEAGFDPALPSAWILEGLIMYLEEQELINLIRVLANLCARGSAFCATCVSTESVARGKGGKSQIMSAWKWGCDDPQAFFDSEWCRHSSASLKGATFFAGKYALDPPCPVPNIRAVSLTLRQKESYLEFHVKGHFPPGWSFERVTVGTPGEFPTGADYSVGFQGKGTAYVFGYSSREGPP